MQFDCQWNAFKQLIHAIDFNNLFLFMPHKARNTHTVDWFVNRLSWNSPTKLSIFIYCMLFLVEHIFGICNDSIRFYLAIFKHSHAPCTWPVSLNFPQKKKQIKTMKVINLCSQGEKMAPKRFFARLVKIIFLPVALPADTALKHSPWLSPYADPLPPSPSCFLEIL